MLMPDDPAIEVKGTTLKTSQDHGVIHTDIKHHQAIQSYSPSINFDGT